MRSIVLINFHKLDASNTPEDQRGERLKVAPCSLYGILN